MNRPQRPLEPTTSSPLCHAVGNSSPAVGEPRGATPVIAGLEVADSSFGAWLAAGGDRRQSVTGPRDAWTPEQRAQRAMASARESQQRAGAANWDALRPHTLKR